MNYQGSKILAPMVRCGTLPLRLQAARYGANIVYSEELIDKKIIQCTRIENTEMGCVDYVKEGSIVFRTIPEERGRLVFQLGTPAADTALKAAQKVIQDVDVIDINMGCPKAFSVQGGMGSCLLTKPETVRDIVHTLSTNLPKPVTCKIRLLPKIQDTIALAKTIEAAGATALAVHGRLVPERPRDPAHWEPIAEIVRSVNIPVLLNGDVYTHEDMTRARDMTGVMLARGALANPSVFRAEGFLPLDDVMRDFVSIASRWENTVSNTKYTLQQMLRYANQTDHRWNQQLYGAKTDYDLWQVLEMGEKHGDVLRPHQPTPQELQQQRKRRHGMFPSQTISTSTPIVTVPDEEILKRVKVDSEENTASTSEQR